jgi:hypothetical protein
VARQQRDIVDSNRLRDACYILQANVSTAFALVPHDQQSAHMAADDTLNKEIADLQQRLVELDRERTSVLTALEQLLQRRWVEAQPTPSSQTEDKTARTPGLSNAEKIALFRSLVAMMFFPADGRMQRMRRLATPQRAKTNGFVVSVRSHGSNAATARTKPSCQSAMKW